MDSLIIQKEIWTLEQENLKKQLICDDSQNWLSKGETLDYIAGVDISFIKDDPVNACAAYVILSYPDLKVVYEDYQMVKLTGPYIPGFLAFREVEHLVKLVNKCELSKQVKIIFVDGNGILHPHGFGLASHLGVLVNKPTIGVGKKLFLIDGFDKKVIKERVEKECKKKGDYIKLIGDSGTYWGVALIPDDIVNNPIYVSLGHMISIEAAIDLTVKASIYRIPEPVRIADIRSRKYLRELDK